MDSASPDTAPEPAPVTTIAWRLAHIIVSCLGYRDGAEISLLGDLYRWRTWTP